MIIREFRAMGCRMAVHLDAEASTARILDSVPGWFEKWEQSLSRFRDSSELNQINRNSGSWQHVGDIFWQVLQLSREMGEYSHGLVTPVVLDALETAGYEFSFEPGQILLNGISTAPHLPAFELSDIEFRDSSREVWMPTGMRLDFGGVAKGWAAHQTMQRLSSYGPVLVNAGGDISISSPRQNGLPWKVGIIDPLHPDMDIVHLSLTTGGLASSGKDYRTWLKDGVLRHHIIDPRTSEPAVTDILTSSVYASTIMEAETAAKVLFIGGSEEENPWLLEHPQIAALEVMDDGSMRATQPMQQLFWRKNGSTDRSN